MDTAEPKLKGADKKEAFHEAAEEKVHTFSFSIPDNVEIPEGKKMHVRLAATDTCRATVQVLRDGSENNLHYHPNMDLIWMVVKGRVRFYGPNNVVRGEMGPLEGILQPENSRYWFEKVGEEEAWLLQIAGFPKGAKAARRVNVDPPKKSLGGVWVGLNDEEKKMMEERFKDERR
jgi:mannose-6-phosphate isomerase-like protein (cupin superfamily)